MNKFLMLIFVSIILISFWSIQSHSVTGSDSKKEKTKVTVDKVNTRSLLRAYYSAPPVIPHDFEDGASMNECLHCHKEVKMIQGRKSVKTPHPQYSNCKQCHVRGYSKNKVKRANPSNWKGLKEPKKGTRAHKYAPPTIPHTVLYRKNCIGCHSSDHVDSQIKGPHNSRSNCLQCHVGNKANEIKTK